MRFRPMLLPLLAAALLGACTATATGSPQASAQAPTAQPSASASGGAGLDGRTFVSTKVAGHDLVAKTAVTLTFKNGQLGANAGCNSMSGAYTLKDGKLSIGQMATTEMGCQADLMAQDQWLAKLLPGAAVSLDGTTLKVTNGDVSITLVDRQTTNLSLEATTWTVNGLISGDAVSSIPQGVTATLVFTAGKVSVNSGCNTGSGTAVIKDGNITFGPISLTKKACGAGAAAVEKQVTSVLTGTQPFKIDGSSLTIGGNGQPGLMLQGKAPQPSDPGPT